MYDVKDVNLSNCDREPIHIPGTIQPHGCLIACDQQLGTILRTSANTASFLGLGDTELNGRELSQALGGDFVHTLRNAAATASEGSRAVALVGQSLTSDGPTFDICVHRYKGAAIIEFEHADAPSSAGPLEISRTLVSSVARFTDLTDLFAKTPRLIRGVLGYDRVMIYQFAHDGSGKVIGEAKRSDLESFNGTYFPATDIPQQARRLYLQNRIRVISNANCERMPIVPEYDASGEPLDLSMAHLRSVSPIHCEYLRNMGVGASMSISIVVDGALWGLIACHHYGPRILSLPQRIAAEMFGEFFSLQIEAMSRKWRLDSAARARRSLDRIMRDASYQGDIIGFLREKLDDFRRLVPCDGVGLWINGTWSTNGDAPPSKAAPSLMRFLGTVTEGRVWASHELSTGHPAASAYADKVSGVLAVPLSQTPKDYLVRKEVVHTLEWAGDPNKKYEVGPHGDRLTPRKSFAIWKQTVERQSIPWTEDDREMAEAARTALLEVVMRHSEILETERQTADVRQKVLNEELNHRVKNILALIKSVVSQPIDPARDLTDYVASLKGRIMALAQAHDQVVRNDGGGALRDLLESELRPYREAASISLNGPDIGLDARAYSVLALVLHELATNAAKYGSLSQTNGVLLVEWQVTDDGRCDVQWTERGGPPTSPPKRQGFGSILLTRSIPFDLGGVSEIHYEREGVTAHFVIPANFISALRHEKPEPRAMQKNQDHPSLDGLKVLLLEDQLVIALDAEAMLQSCGVGGVDTTATASEALRTLVATAPDIAVLDVNLGSGNSFPVAEELRRRKIPFIFATGYGDHTIIPKSLADVPVVRKPYDPDALAATMARALAGRDA
ncbi:MAG: GAF domain-containing protein [Alphaproteobacteria bacterium]|nr:GAF domain-containing protein [Alphaproteobacteria bacterium]